MGGDAAGGADGGPLNGGEAEDAGASDNSAAGVADGDRIDGVLPVEGLDELFRQLDELSRCRPRRNPRMPLLQFRGTEAEAVVTSYRGRLISTDGMATVPYAFCDGSALPADELALFDNIAEALYDSVPSRGPLGLRGMKGPVGLRLPRYWLVREVLKPSNGADAPLTTRAMRNSLYNREDRNGAPRPGGWLRSLADVVGADAAIGPVRFGPISRAAEVASKFLFGLRLQWGRRYRWFTREVSDVDPPRKDFLAAARSLAPGGALRKTERFTLVRRRILMLALLRDLQAATRPGLVSPSQRRRVTPFVLLLTGVTPNSPGHRLLRTLDSIGSRDLKRHTILVLAAHEAGDLPVPAAPKCGHRAAAKRLEPLARKGETADSALVIEAPAVPLSDTVGDRLNLNPKVPQPRPRFPVGPVVVGCLVILALILPPDRSPIIPSSDPSCPHLEETSSDEVIGVGDGTTDCSFFEEPTGPAQTEIYRDLAAVEQEIAEENERVLETAEQQGHPYSTIVYFAPMTVPNVPGRLGENAVNQLRGVALAQRRANELVGPDPDRVFSRIVLANPGDRFARGVDVAAQIVDLAEEDDTIIGVAGISQSRDASRAAIAELGNADGDGDNPGLPVVAGPVTGDRMIDASPHYFQVSPRNLRIAAALVEFSTTTEIVRDEGEPAVPDGAVVVTDHTDEYADNLADDLYDAFVEATGRDQVDVISHPVEETGADPPTTGPDGRTTAQVGGLDELARQVCAALDERDVLFYTSRSQEFVGMLNSMRDEGDCPDEFTVVAGSALTKLADDPEALARHGHVDLYYAGFASRDVWFNPATGDFLDRYDEAYNPDSGIHDAALSYDAITTLQWTADHARQNHLPITASTSANTLGGDEVRFNGVSGYIALGNDPIDGEAPRVPPAKPVLILQSGETGVLLECGHRREGELQDTWGPDERPCPTVD